MSEEDWEVPPPLRAITREKDSNEYRSWVEEERQKLVKEEEEAVVDIELEEEKEPLKVSDACTQTPKRRRSGRKASRMRRLLAFQQMLTKKKGLPKSRLLTLKEADARQSEREKSLWLQEESASPLLRRRQASLVKADKEEGNADSLEKEQEGKNIVGTSTGDEPTFTPRSSQSQSRLFNPFPANASGNLLPPSFHDLLYVGPLHTTDDLLHTFTLWPDAWTPVGDVWQLPFLGHCRHVIVVMLE